MPAVTKLSRIFSSSSRVVVDLSGPSLVRPELASEQDVHRIVARLRSGVVPIMRPASSSGTIDFDRSASDRAISFKRLEDWYRSSSFSGSVQFPDFSSFLSGVERGDVRFSDSAPVKHTRRSSDSPRTRRGSDLKAAETSAVVAEVVAALGKRERASSAT